MTRRATPPIAPLVRLWRSLIALVLAFGLAGGPAAASLPLCAAPAGDAVSAHVPAHAPTHAVATDDAGASELGVADLAGEGLAPDADADECQRDHCQHPTAPAAEAFLKGLLTPRRRRRPPPRGRGLPQAPRRLLERPPRA